MRAAATPANMMSSAAKAVEDVPVDCKNLDGAVKAPDTVK
jgi:hypothetical protein